MDSVSDADAARGDGRGADGRTYGGTTENSMVHAMHVQSSFAISLLHALGFAERSDVSALLVLHATARIPMLVPGGPHPQPPGHSVRHCCARPRAAVKTGPRRGPQYKCLHATISLLSGACNLGVFQP